MAANRELELVKITKISLTLNDIIKGVFTDEYGLVEYKDCKIIDESRETKIDIVDLEEFKFFIVNYKGEHRFTLVEFMLFNPTVNTTKFDLYVPETLIQETLNVEDIPDLDDKLLNYN